MNTSKFLVAFVCFVAIYLALRNTLTDSVPEFLQTVYAGFRGFILGQQWIPTLNSHGGGVGAFTQLTIGIWAAAVLCFLAGRSVLQPLLSFLPKPDPSKTRSKVARFFDFILPPPPPKTIKGKPAFDVIGIPMAAFVHLLPPTGPWAVRLIIDIGLGASPIKLKTFAIGGLLGIVLHLLAIIGIKQIAPDLPPPPTGLIGLIMFFAPPIIITTLVRSILLLKNKMKTQS